MNGPTEAECYLPQNTDQGSDYHPLLGGHPDRMWTLELVPNLLLKYLVLVEQALLTPAVFLPVVLMHTSLLHHPGGRCVHRQL